MLLHLVLRLIVLSCSCLQFWFQHTHLGTTHVALLHHRIGDQLQQQGDENQYDTHREDLAQPVEDIEREETVDPTDDRPSEINQLLELQVLVESTFLLSVLQNLEVVRTIVELKLRCLLASRVEGCLHLSLELLQIARTFLLRNRSHEGVLVEIVLCHDDGREELVLEGYPVDALLDSLVDFLASLVEVVGAALYIMIGEGGVAILEHEATLLLASLVAPVHVHLAVVR